jgi:hypothetical protein
LPQTAEQIHAELADFIGEFYADPLGFVIAAFPWGEPGPLQDHTGPDTWQREFMQWLGEEVTKRKFDGQSAVEPVRAAVSSGVGPVDHVHEAECAWDSHRQHRPPA